MSTLLVTSLDCETTLGEVARRVVPYLADSFLVYLVEPDDRIRLVCAAHADLATPELGLGSEPAETLTGRLAFVGN